MSSGSDRRLPATRALPPAVIDGVIADPLIPVPVPPDQQTSRMTTWRWDQLTPGAKTRVQEALNDLEKDLGGRKPVFQTLMIAAMAPSLTGASGGLSPALAARATELAQLLAQPKYAAMTLGKLARKVGIDLSDFITLYKEARLVRAHLQTLNEIAAGIPATVKDIMRRAAPYQDTCHACGGLGQVTPNPTKQEPNPKPGPCETCKGSGQLLYPADPVAQEHALVLAGLLKGAGNSGVSIAVQQNLTNQQITTVTAITGTFARVQAATDEILYGSTPIRRGPSTPSTPAEGSAEEAPHEPDPVP